MVVLWKIVGYMQIILTIRPGIHYSFIHYDGDNFLIIQDVLSVRFILSWFLRTPSFALSVERRVPAVIGSASVAVMAGCTNVVTPCVSRRNSASWLEEYTVSKKHYSLQSITLVKYNVSSRSDSVANCASPIGPAASPVDCIRLT